MKHLVRVAAMSPQVHIGNVTKNCEEIEAIYRAYAEQADIIVTPELSLTGYTCGGFICKPSAYQSGSRRTG